MAFYALSVAKGMDIIMNKMYEPPIIVSIDKLKEVKPQCAIALKPKRACKSLPSGIQNVAIVKK